MTHAEKRRETRRQASGTVHVRFSNPHPTEIEGQLLDVSAGGFRMSHRVASLETGEIVEFTHAEARGRARVMWNRITGDLVETGFLVLTPAKS